ncbi:MAG: aminopeptidase P family protein [Hyphomicrobiales bacterium]|nr:aminopeptidase P family protein [Hyphomicrobiales bacterium]
MSKSDFSAEEFADRQRRVRVKMEEKGINLLLIFHPTNIQYLSGSRAKSYQEFQVLFFPLENAPMTIMMRLAEVPEMTDHSLAEDVRGWGGREPEDPVEVFASLLREKGYMNRRIGLEVPDFYMHPYSYTRIRDLLGDALCLDASFLIHDLKLVKSPAELACIRRAAEIADAGMHTAQKAISEGVSEMEVSGEVYRTLLSSGSDLPASPMNFVSGERTCYGHGAPSPRKIRRGDFMHLEYGAAIQRYTATIARHFCLGEPTARMRELHQVVLDACDACIAEIRAGVPAVTPHLAAKNIIADRGLDQYRLHTTGYGIAPGYPPSWGEYIHLFGDSTYTLEAGMVISVEPPVFLHEEKLGARIIDNLLVTETGCEILSGFTRDLTIIEP